MKAPFRNSHPGYNFWIASTMSQETFELQVGLVASLREPAGIRPGTQREEKEKGTCQAGQGKAQQVWELVVYGPVRNWKMLTAQNSLLVLKTIFFATSLSSFGRDVTRLWNNSKYHLFPPAKIYLSSSYLSANEGPISWIWHLSLHQTHEWGSVPSTYKTFCLPTLGTRATVLVIVSLCMG